MLGICARSVSRQPLVAFRARLVQAAVPACWLAKKKQQSLFGFYKDILGGEEKVDAQKPAQKKPKPKTEEVVITTAPVQTPPQPEPAVEQVVVTKRTAPADVQGPVKLEPLPFSLTGGLAPAISNVALSYHYEFHHRNYVNAANTIIAGMGERFKDKELIDIIYESSEAPELKKLCNNLCQVWNHQFFWNCMKPSAQPIAMPEALQLKLEKKFGSVDKFKAQFKEVAMSHFGAGWAWLVEDPAKELAIVSTANEQPPFLADMHPLLTLDLWEHAYYLDHQNRRADFIDSFWNVVDWEFVNARAKME